MPDSATPRYASTCEQRGIACSRLPITDQGIPSIDEARELSAEIEALLTEGVDALLFDSFTRLPHLMVILDVLREIEARPPVIAQMSLSLTSGNVWDQDPGLFVNTAAEMGADVVGVNGSAPRRTVQATSHRPEPLTGDWETSSGPGTVSGERFLPPCLSLRIGSA